jgi:hypothetical protein
MYVCLNVEACFFESTLFFFSTDDAAVVVVKNSATINSNREKKASERENLRYFCKLRKRFLRVSKVALHEKIFLLLSPFANRESMFLVKNTDDVSPP